MTQRQDGPKLPVKQLAILAIARFSEPMALTSVFPYLPEMIASFGVGKNDVPKWAGYTGATFSVFQSLTAVPWGKASDTFGRKPIVLLGLLNTMICFIIWGMSTSLVMAITVRAIMGAGNGNVGIIRTMVAEMVPERELQPRAFSLMPLVWSLGSVFGPMFGGFFAQPARQYPAWFGNIWFFNAYPFALPNLIAFVVFAISFMTGLLFLQETLESKRHDKDWGLRMGGKLSRSWHRQPPPRRPRLSMCDDEAQAPLLTDRNARDYMTVPGGKTKTKAVPPKAVTMADIFTSQTLVCLLSYTFLSLHSVAFDQVLPVFLHYPTLDPDSDVHLPFQFAGGFGFSSDKIGTISTLYGVACGVIQFQLFPWLCARFGVLACYRLSSAVFPLVYLLTPFTAVLATPPARYAALLLLLLVKGCVVIVGFPCITILLTNSAASLRVLGTLNGYATTLSGVGRALGPAMTGAMFTWGVGRGYIIAPWWLLCAVAAAGAIPPYFIQEGEGPRRADDMDMETETETETAAESEAGPSRSGSDDETRRPASGPLARSPSRK